MTFQYRWLLNRGECMGRFECIWEIPLNKKNDTYYLNLTALIRDYFRDIGKHLEDVRVTEVQSIKTCIGILLTELRQTVSTWSHNRCGCQTLFNQQGNDFLYNFFVIILASHTRIERTLIYSKSSQTLAKIMLGGRHQTS